ncbi:hypothetical protein [Glycomyces arizonensis]|uniref:hypothetical protein n=1 Tax=Glycomyces arizonensis TaxID=256035 RepID=UPI00040312DA|nr:hypothetical protein [Glycomyces arizonensis]
MSPRSSVDSRIFTTGDGELLSCLIAAPSQALAAEWLDITPTHLRRQLKELRDKAGVDTNSQLIVLATVSGVVDPAKVLPYTVSPCNRCRPSPQDRHRSVG